MSDPTAAIFAALIAGVFLGAGAQALALGSSPRPPRKPRVCNACGHDRGWHPTYWPTNFPILYGCKHNEGRMSYDECRCPAGRRSIR